MLKQDNSNNSCKSTLKSKVKICLLMKVNIHMVNLHWRQIYISGFTDQNQLKTTAWNYWLIISKKTLFNPNNIGKTRNNLKKEETLALNEMKSWEDKVVRVQDKSWRFVFLNTNSYIEKVQLQTDRSFSKKLNSNSSFEFTQKVIDWIERWSKKINEKLK